MTDIIVDITEPEDIVVNITSGDGAELSMTSLTDVNSIGLTTTGQFPSWDSVNQEFNFSENITNYSQLTHSNAVFVAKVGSDSNTGLKIEQPKLTISSALSQANTLISGGATGVRIHVLDGGTYTENITIPTSVLLDARACTFLGTVTITGGAEVYLDRHFATANNQVMLSMEADTSGSGIYHSNISDGRGTSGTLTGVRNVRNVGGGGKNLFVNVGIMFVGISGVGVGDVSGGVGHIHLYMPDLYLAGANATGILGSNQGPNVTNTVGWIDHILEFGSPNGCVAISMNSATASIRLSCAEITSETAYNISAGSLYLSCPRLVGTRTGTPLSLFSDVETITNKLVLKSSTKLWDVSVNESGVLVITEK